MRSGGLTQWVAHSLLSKKQCLIYGEIKAEVRRGSACQQLVWSAALHTQLYFTLFSKWKHGQCRGRRNKASGEVAGENAGLSCR